jgi:hypothetical protein
VKKHVAKKWVAALRSGKYDQTRRVLSNSEGYCCLGVLCDIAPKAVGKWVESTDINKSRNFVSTTKDQSVARPTTKVVEWAGLKNRLGKHDGMKSCLATMNDNGASFTVIADIIEAEWELL